MLFMNKPFTIPLLFLKLTSLFAMIKIYNTLSKNKETFKPIQEGQVNIYVCGMTVYDLCHIGHARVMVIFDVVRRWFDILGYSVNYVRNITDIDDKIINRSIQNNESIESSHAKIYK